MMRRLFLGLSAAALAAAATTSPVGASTGPGSTSSPHSALVTCSNFPGHYCARVFYTSVHGGIDLTSTRSTGYTTGPGKAREYFRYSCKAGTCYILPSALFVYSRSDVQLNVQRTFSGSGFFLPCGARFGVDYINPAVHAPGPGPVLFKVTC